MKIKVRYGVYETNSSSVHNLCVHKDNNVEIPTLLYLFRGEYGWGKGSVSYTPSYVFEACLGLDEVNKNLEYGPEHSTLDYYVNGEWAEITGFTEESYTNKFLNKLKEFGIEVRYELGRYMDGYIDHVEDLEWFIEELLENNDFFKRFLFNDNSVIYTGNDNDEYAYPEMPNNKEDYDIY